MFIEDASGDLYNANNIDRIRIMQRGARYVVIGISQDSTKYEIALSPYFSKRIMAERAMKKLWSSLNKHDSL